MKRARAIGGGSMAAWFAVFALVLQTLIAVPAHAGGGSIEICTPQGIQTIHVGQSSDDGQPAKSKTNHCGLCVLAAPVDTAPARLATPIRYAYRVVLAPIAADAPPASARGPPRPFGQAPPASLIA